MAENRTKSSDEKINLEVEETPPAAQPSAENENGGGGWGFSPFSYLSDLQKVATVAAEEISRNAADVAKSFTDIQSTAEDSESSKEDGIEGSGVEDESENENDKRRKEALDKLERASEDSLLNQGVKVFDDSVDSLTSGAWQAIGNAWKGGANLVQKLENSASNFSRINSTWCCTWVNWSCCTIFSGDWKGFYCQGNAKTGIEVEGSTKESEGRTDEDQQFEEVTFERCFYSYGGPEQLEELEVLSNHYALLLNRRKAKLSTEQKTIYDGKLKDVQHVFDMGAELDGNSTESGKGKKNLHDSSVRKAAELAAGFASSLAELAPNDIIQRTAGRLDSLHSEGVHVCRSLGGFLKCAVVLVTQLLMLGKSIISHANRVQDQEIYEETVKIDCPEDSVETVKIIRMQALSMTGNLESVFNSFIKGISDVAEACSAAA
ncbi:hypothetical protein Adt_43628 [Abeliophyllum distichum]|uniref:DUF7798 domain-containing protein n=1 Tax=Abeliophyllum distichum TaxID=126358 RepID=A0ABD1PA26_9LAMI